MDRFDFVSHVSTNYGFIIYTQVCTNYGFIITRRRQDDSSVYMYDLKVEQIRR